ncbi:leucine-rich repeat, immunoglobulin-like domain and transmembrane domain-containing protein 3 isoform X1 [Lepisosteus oculatus]|uniref:leucine-rich repeat, immunoglobulin-like domain and transmembrane domain-containing protein 3 isoform X1 n=1 Tax=Lepisosteus oculatus TaxID=7918 RepID=UPI0035F5219B
MYQLICILVLVCCFNVVLSFCPSQCTCIYHGRSDGTGTRSVLCNDPDMSDIPVNVPVDTVKLRIEKTVIRRIPTEAFYYLVDLKYLWVTYNSISTIDSSSFYNLKLLHELRLDGNQISTFPWESLQEMPNLRTLDLHNNRLSTIPADAAQYLWNITYLDISSNKLTTLPSDLIDIWPPFSGAKSASTPQRVILGLQDNPWFCDCRISKVIELSKTFETSVVLLDPLLICSGPENLSGVLFQRAELEQCLKPSVMTSATKITSPLGSNVLLRCDATGYPTPVLMWTRSDESPVNNTACCRQVDRSSKSEKLPRTLNNFVQESPGEGIRWSIISLNGILYKDAGEYRCKAKNLAGMAEASITLTVVGVVTTTVSPLKFPKKPSNEQSPTNQTQTEPVMVTTIALTTPFSTTPAPTMQSTTPRKKLQPNSQQKLIQGGEVTGKGQPANNNNKTPQQVEKKQRTGSNPVNTTSSALRKLAVKNVQVVDQSTESAVLTWKADEAQRDLPVKVIYSPFGEKEKQSVSTELGKSQIILDGLRPNTKYMACFIPKGNPPQKDQCVTFSTLETVNADGQDHLLIIVSSIACVVALPLIILLLYKVLKLYCKKGPAPGGEDPSKEMYVKFETLSLKQRTMGPSTDLWTRRHTAESERMLLCSRSSIDSQMTFKSDSSRSEYLC